MGTSFVFPAVRPPVAPLSAAGVRTLLFELHSAVMLLGHFAFALGFIVLAFFPFSLSLSLCHGLHVHGEIFEWASTYLGFQETDDLAAHRCIARAFLRVEPQPSLAECPCGCRQRALSSCHLDLCDQCIFGRAVPGVPYQTACPTLCTVEGSARSLACSWFCLRLGDHILVVSILQASQPQHPSTSVTRAKPSPSTSPYVGCMQLCTELSHVPKQLCAICACPSLFPFVVVESFQLVSCPSQQNSCLRPNCTHEPCQFVREHTENHFISFERCWFCRCLSCPRRCEAVTGISSLVQSHQRWLCRAPSCPPEDVVASLPAADC